MKRYLTLYIVFLFWGCYSSSFKQKANIPAINQRILINEELTFISPGENEYMLTVERMDSLHLEGSGKMRKNSISEWENYEGIIPIDSIEILCFSEKDVGKSLLINTAVLTLLVKGLQADAGPYNPTVELVYPPGADPAHIFMTGRLISTFWKVRHLVLLWEKHGK